MVGRARDRAQEASGRTSMIVSVITQIGMRKSRFEEHVEQQLIPGIPDEVTLEHISSKLSWRDLHSLPVVSRGWQQAIQSRQVYNARVKSNSTETLVVVNHKAGPENFIALYSTSERCFYFVPSIPHFDGGIPMFCNCVSLDGKLYILGGVKKQHIAIDPSRHGVRNRDVYVLDLVGRRQWKPCASLQVQRIGSACDVLDGKIYVFGGYSFDGPVHVSEVYDPELDSWSLITPMISSLRRHHVAAVGEELCVYGGVLHDRDDPNRDLDFYHPVRNEWRKVDSLRRNGEDSLRRNREPSFLWNRERLFEAGGKFYSMTRVEIKVHDSEKGSWTHLHSFSLEAFRPADCVGVDLGPVVATENELLAMVHMYRRDNGPRRLCLLRSRGFGSENERILWDKVNCSLFCGAAPFIYPVQL